MSDFEDEPPQYDGDAPEAGDAGAGAPRSALEASIRSKGRNSYYYAHSKKLGASSSWCLRWVKGVLLLVVVVLLWAMGVSEWRGLTRLCVCVASFHPFQTRPTGTGTRSRGC